MPHPGRIAWVADLGPEPVERAAPDPRQPRPRPARSSGPGVPAFLADPDNPYRAEAAVPGARSTGRRLALARWLTRPGSRPAALLARVLANRIWQHHFGTGLAATSDNLGYTGAPPTHPELLEYLAGELVRSGWSAKALHRLILNSAVWRQSSAPRPEAPDDRSRQPPAGAVPAPPARRRGDSRRHARRLGRARRPPGRAVGRRPSGPTRARSCPTIRPAPACAASVYLQQRRTQIASLLEVFDAPSIVTTCTRRLPATIPLQSLSLLNSDFVVARAEKLAERLERECRRRTMT